MSESIQHGVNGTVHHLLHGDHGRHLASCSIATDGSRHLLMMNPFTPVELAQVAEFLAELAGAGE